MKALFTYYSIDECTNLEQFYSKLEILKGEGKIEFRNESLNVIKLTDISLEEQEISELLKFLDILEVYPYLDHDSDDYEIDDRYEEDENDNFHEF